MQPACSTATVSQVSGVTNKVSFSYANSGLRTTMTDTNGVTQWAYAGASEGAGVPTVKTETRLVPGVTTSVITYAYWATGMRKSMVVTNAGTRVSVLEYTYDVADRLTNIAATAGASVMHYPYSYKQDWDLIESVKGVCASGTYEQSFTHDSLGRRCSVTAVNKGTTLSSRTYGYDAAGQRTSQSISYSPPGGSQAPATSYSLAYGYDQYGQLTNAHKTKNGTPQKDYNYAYQFDSIGNRLSETRNAFSLTYANNSLDQITNRSWSGGLTVQGYAGSRSNTAVLGSAAGVEAVDVNVQPADLDTNGEYVVQSITVNAGTNNLITAVNKDAPLPPNGSTNLAGTKSILWKKVAVEPQAITLRYDGAGNLTNDGMRSYTWDGNGMLTRVQSGGVRSDYGYDGMSRKVRSRDYVYSNSTWQLTADRVFVYDGWNPVVELTNQSSTLPSFHLSKSYVWGMDMSGTLSGAGGVGGLLSATTHCSPLTTHWFAYNGNGDVVCTINCADGAISSRYEYDPFGRLICKEGVYADENEYRFSTKRYCRQWSMYDYGYRHYSPDLGRWMSRDPDNNTAVARVLVDVIDNKGMSESTSTALFAKRNTINQYQFCYNTPFAHFDPYGLEPTTPGMSVDIKPASITPYIYGGSDPRQVRKWVIKLRILLINPNKETANNIKYYYNACDMGVGAFAEGGWQEVKSVVTHEVHTYAKHMSMSANSRSGWRTHHCSFLFAKVEFKDKNGCDKSVCSSQHTYQYVSEDGNEKIRADFLEAGKPPKQVYP